MKNVLVLVHDDAGQEARLCAALDLTRALSGHLTCIDVVELPVIVDAFGGASSAMIVQDARDFEAENRARLQQRLASEDVSWSLEEASGDLAGCILDTAKTADIIVLNRKLDGSDFPDMRYVAGRVLTHSRALVLAVDEERRSFEAAGNALIAWDGSETTMSVLARATPLLALAGDVEIFQVGNLGRGVIPAEDAATYLSRHGIKVSIEKAPAADSIAVAIRIEAERFNAAYCAMGAFTHSRAREALFGGVTRTMLTACTLPLVLGH